MSNVHFLINDTQTWPNLAQNNYNNITQIPYCSFLNHNVIVIY
jgi:hypothetical protein